MVIAFELKIPPSFNSNWIPIKRNNKPAIVRNPIYKEWVNLSHKEILSKGYKGIKGNYSLEIFFPKNMRGDKDNRIKAINDILERSGLVENDKLNDRLFYDFSSDVTKGKCIIFLYQYLEEEHNVKARFLLYTGCKNFIDTSVY